jgi:TRAP-type C4-dicarboxylate transport system permease small subunit
MVWKALRTWSDWVNRGVEGALFAIGVAMALITGIQVFSRYALNHSLFWSEEFGRGCLVWITFLGGSAAYKRRAHIGLGFLVARFSHDIQRGLGIVVLLLSLGFFAILVVYGCAFVLFTAGQKTPALGIPKAIPYLAVPLGGLAFFLHGLSHLADLLARPRAERF